jgi:RNA polymerase sigma-70 factor (ECF subfamily)
MNEPQQLLGELKQTRQRFLELVSEVRPDLHRYCARMVGSITEGEDVVQEALARAYYQLSELQELPALRSWLFRIAHNQAIDAIRKRQRQQSEPIESIEDSAMDEAEAAEAIIAREHALGLAMSRFLELSALQRSCVILKDVLDHSLEDIAVLLDTNINAVKAALHRGRARTRALAAHPAPSRLGEIPQVLQQYVDLFNARDWDGVRALLVDDVKLDLVSMYRRSGRSDVGTYFSNYERITGWYLRVGWLQSQPILAVVSSGIDADPKYLIDLQLRDDRIAHIRDFRYVPYIAHEADLRFANGERQIRRFPFIIPA